MPVITLRILVPEGTTAYDLRDLLKEELIVGEPYVTQLRVMRADAPLEDDDEVDLTPDEDNEPSDEPK